MLVSSLEKKLLERFPTSSAEPWDHAGLSVGDPAAEITGIVCALDATVDSVRYASENGANVLLTHHPVYIKAPESFVPSSPAYPASASTVYEAARCGVSIISLHTNLDRSFEARALLPILMGYRAKTSLECAGAPDELGLGSICDVDETSLLALAQQSARAFGTSPRVWGSPKTPVRRVAFLGGSLGGFGEQAIQNNVDALICGEAGYHICQDLETRGLGIILLGHDRSERPFVEILAKAAHETGVPSALIDTMGDSHQWWTVTKGDCS